MNNYILIDPALKGAYIKFSNGKITQDCTEVDSKKFWPRLREAIEKLNSNLSEINFFINFGPGSYTGLKQSKILAEILSTDSNKIYIYNQQSVLDLAENEFKVFVSPAYKGQLFVAMKNTNVIQVELISNLIWDQYCKTNHIEPSEIISSVSSFIIDGEEYKYLSLEKFYKKLELVHFIKISKKYENQDIFYYRADIDDYKPSIHN